MFFLVDYPRQESRKMRHPGHDNGQKARDLQETEFTDLMREATAAQARVYYLKRSPFPVPFRSQCQVPPQSLKC